MGNIKGLTPGKHGFHVHQSGELGNGCQDAGGHYNPNNKTHGDLDADIRHEGDFGNIKANSDGEASINITKTGSDLNKLIGRAIVVHEKEDDLGLGIAPDSKTTGTAGARLDCCLIQWEASSALSSSSLLSLIISVTLLALSQSL